MKIDLSVAGRFLAYIQKAVLAPAKPSDPIHVAVIENGRGGWCLFPANAAAFELFRHRADNPHVSLHIGSFAMEADAERRAKLNGWVIATGYEIIRDTRGDPRCIYYPASQVDGCLPVAMALTPVAAGETLYRD